MKTAQLWETGSCRQNPPKAQEAEEAHGYDSPNNYYHNDNYTTPGANRVCRPFDGQGGYRQFRAFTQRSKGQRPQYNQHQFQTYRPQRGTYQYIHNQYGTHHKPYFQRNQTSHYRGQNHGRVLSNLQDADVVGPITRVTMTLISIRIIHMISRQNSMA